MTLFVVEGHIVAQFNSAGFCMVAGERDLILKIDVGFLTLLIKKYIEGNS